MGHGSPVTGGRLQWPADVLVEAGVRQWCMDVVKLAGSNWYSPAQHILHLYFNSLSRRYGGLTSRIRQTAAPCGSRAPTQSTRRPRPRGVYSVEHALSFPPRNLSHLRLSLCFERHQIQRPVISLLPFGSKHWSCRLLRFRQPAPFKYGKLQKL